MKKERGTVFERCSLKTEKLDISAVREQGAEESIGA
jgi:hypothetical protein